MFSSFSVLQLRSIAVELSFVMIDFNILFKNIKDIFIPSHFVAIAYIKVELFFLLLFDFFLLLLSEFDLVVSWKLKY